MVGIFTMSISNKSLLKLGSIKKTSAKDIVLNEFNLKKFEPILTNTFTRAVNQTIGMK